MKKLKITLLAALVFTSAGAFSQTFGLGAGANFSNVAFSGADTDDDFFDGYKTLIGFNAGGFYDLNFSDNIGLRFGLKYSGKGYRYKDDFSESYSAGGVTYTQESSTDIKTTLNYLQINPMFKFQMEVGRDNAFYAMVGPYISVGLSGRQKGEQSYSYSDGTTSVSETETYNEKIEFGEDGDGIDRLDFGFTPAIGFEVKNVFMEASYDFGLNNIDSYDDPDFKASNRNFSVTVGYVFGK